jgi:hypothetical protein
MIWYFSIGVVLFSIIISLLAGAIIKWADSEDVR